MTIFEKLSAIQAELKVPKGQFNSFGGYSYRSCEDILEVAKPICAKHKTVLILSDELVNIGERYYVRASAQLQDLEAFEFVSTYAYAREEETKKGMDGSQVTGASSSYARKYALNGLFNIDDVKDSDFTNTHQKEPQNMPKPVPKPTPKPSNSDADLDRCDSCGTKISDKVRDFSVKKFGVPLCMDCQKDYAR